MSHPAPSLPVSPPWGMGQGGTPVMIPPNLAGPGGVPQVAAATLQLPLPEVYPIPDAREFNPLGQNNSAGAESNIEIPGTSLDIPPDMYGIIRGVSLYIANMLATTNVSWTLQIQGAAPQGFQALTIFPRVAPFVSNGFDSFIRFQGPCTIRVIYTNTDGGAYTVGASYSGWFWPQASDARWRRLGV